MLLMCFCLYSMPRDPNKRRSLLSQRYGINVYYETVISDSVVDILWCTASIEHVCVCVRSCIVSFVLSVYKINVLQYIRLILSHCVAVRCANDE